MEPNGSGTPRSATPVDLESLWLETDGLGGYACGSVSGVCGHRSQSLFTAAKNPPLERYLLLNGLEVRLTTEDGEEYPLTSHRFGSSGKINPDGRDHIRAFRSRPWPQWQYQTGNGLSIEHEFFMRHGSPLAVASWKLHTPRAGVRLHVRPLLSGRRIDQLQKSTSHYRFQPEIRQRLFVWEPYDDVPALAMLCDGEFAYAPDWRIAFTYQQDMTPNGPAREDLAIPGEFVWDLSRGRAHLAIGVDGSFQANNLPISDPRTTVQTLRKAETTRRRLFRNPLELAADSYLVTRKRDDSLHVMASYPLGSQRLTDALIGLRGICLSPGRLGVAEQVLMGLQNDFCGGLLPSVFSEFASGEIGNYDSPDASLWYVVGAYDFIRACRRQEREIPPAVAESLDSNISGIIEELERGNTYGMVVDDEGLLRRYPAFTSRDAASPRLFNVATQALWLNALWIAGRSDPARRAQFEDATDSFINRFWFEEGGYLYDEFPADQETSGTTIRARQILAVGGLPRGLLDEARASLLVELVEDVLWTPRGLRMYRPEEGAPVPLSSWLTGPFVEAWFRVHRHETTVFDEIKERFIVPWEGLLKEGGLNHLGEISNDPEIPEIPFHAPATAELLRILHLPDRAGVSAAGGS